MKIKHLLSTGLLALLNFTSFAQDLDFATTAPLYPAGAATHSYVGIGTPAVNVDLSINGPGTASIASPERAGTGLSTPNWKFNNSGETRSYSFTFGDPVTGLEFALIALQYRTFANTDHNYQDKITILATDEFGNSVMPVIPAGTGYSVNGNEVLATSTGASNVNKVRFPTKVKNVTILFGNGPMAGPSPNGQGFTIGDMDWSGVVLPVEFSYFRAKPIGSVVQLVWETATERNSDFFAIEHSLDLNAFTAIGRLKAVGDATRSQSYAFVDDRAHRTTNYYRLRQIDKDGSERFSKIISTRHDSYLADLTVYPNPSDGHTIYLQFNELDLNALQLTDMNGRKLDFRLTETITGRVMLEPLIPLNPGFYFLSTNKKKAIHLVVK